jgi:peroxiredoxin
MPSDSIFKSIFHIKGETKALAAYDYFYDGLNSYEVQHKDKKVLLINPRLFPNDENNRAKARVSMQPFNYYITDTALKKHLLSDDPQLKMQTLPRQYILTLNYPVNKNGQKFILELTINKQTFSIEKVYSLSELNGTTFKTTNQYSDIVLNDSSIELEIPIKRTYDGYSTHELKPVKPQVKKIPWLGMAAKEFHYKTFDDKDISLSSLKGKYVLLDFWESWCGHCIISIPKIQKLYEIYQAKGLNVIGVTTENPIKISELIKANKLKYQTLKADKQILINYDVSNRPTYVLIDTKGEIINRSEGDLDEIIKIINDKLK